MFDVYCATHDRTHFKRGTKAPQRNTVLSQDAFTQSAGTNDVVVHDTVRVRINRSEGTNDAIVYNVVHNTVRVRTEVLEATTRPTEPELTRGETAESVSRRQGSNKQTFPYFSIFSDTNLFSP